MTWGSWTTDVAAAVVRSAPVFEEHIETPAPEVRARLLAALGTIPAAREAAVRIERRVRDIEDDVDRSATRHAARAAPGA